MVGEVTDNRALVQVRLTQNDDVRVRETPGEEDWWVEFVVKPVGSSDETEQRSTMVASVKEHDYIARWLLDELKPNTEYEVTTLIGRAEALRGGPVARFKTLPGATLVEPVRFAVVTGMNYAKFHGDDRIDRAQHLIENNTELPRPYAGSDKHLGYPALASILKEKPDFFVGTGDNVYYDTPDKPRAETIAELRGKWHQQFSQPRYHDLFAEVPTYWEIDDHDYRIDDCDNTGDYKPTPAEGRALMLEQLPIAPHEEAADALTYRTHRVSKDLQIWLTEGRIHRSPNAMPDGPDKTLWGAEQKAWLKRTLAESDATYKLLISPTPMIGPDDLRKTDNHTNIGGFRHERDEFFAWLKETGIDKKGFHIVCGDRHWQYHAVDPSGIEEFSCGALVDANSRLGRKPGDPASTDPDGLIKQPYYQTPRSGGYLIVEVLPAKEQAKATLAFRWYDEHGELLHEHVK